jgi:hypothetical protein
MGEIENTCKNMIGKPEGRLRRRKEGSIAETGWVAGDWIYLHQDGGTRLDFFETVSEFQVV